MSYDIGQDMIDSYEKFPTSSRFDLDNNQENFLHKLSELWDNKTDEPYYEFCNTIRKVLHKGWYDEEEQYEIKDMIQIYKDDLER